MSKTDNANNSNNNVDAEIQAEVERLFTDPKNAGRANMLRGSVRRILAEIASEEEENKKKDSDGKPRSFLDELFGSKD